MVKAVVRRRQKKKKKKKPSPQRGERKRERERVTCVKKNASTIVRETWWWGIATKFMTFHFFYCYIQVSARCVWMKIIIFFSFYLLR